MKRILTLLFLLISLSGYGQWIGLTGTAQKNTSTNSYRWNFGSNGLFYPAKLSYVDSLLALKAPISGSSYYIQSNPSTAQTANILLNGDINFDKGTSGGSFSTTGFYFGNANGAHSMNQYQLVMSSASDNSYLTISKEGIIGLNTLNGDRFAHSPIEMSLNNYGRSRALQIKPADTGSVTNYLPSSDGQLATIEGIGLVTPQMFGAKADGTTDDATSMQAAINFAAANNKTLFIPAAGIYRMYASMKLKDKITIKSNGATLYSTPTNLSVKSFFELDSLASPATDIEIDGINTIGLVEIKFIVNKSGGGASPRTPIKRISIKNIQSELQPITIDFNPEYIELRNITTGFGLSVSDLYTSAITVSNDPTFTTGKSLLMDNCYVWGGTKDADMFFIKGGSYKDVRLTNLTANSIGSIASRSGDGFDMDGLGKNVVIENIRAINCGIEIKQGATIFSTYNLTASNLTAINPSNAGISLRAPGNYTNILVQNPVATGLAITGYLPTDGSAQADNFININNAQVINAGAKASSSAAVTIGSDNINLTNLFVFNEFGTATPITTAVRFSSSKTVSITNLTIKDAVNAITLSSSSVLEDVSINSSKFNNVTAKILNSSATSITNMSMSDLKFNNFTGTAAIGLGSTSYTNIRFNDFPNTVVHQLIGTTAFNSVSPNFLLNNVLYDKTVAAGALPTLNSLFPIGHVAQNVADGKLYSRVSTSTTPSVAFSAINNGNVINVKPITSKTSNYTVTTSDNAIICDATSGSFTVTLLSAAAGSGYTYIIKKIDASANTVTIKANGSEFIDGSNTQVISVQNKGLIVRSNGTQWYVIGSF